MDASHLLPFQLLDKQLISYNEVKNIAIYKSNNTDEYITFNYLDVRFFVLNGINS